MRKFFKKINKGPVQYRTCTGSGFAILFAVTLAAIVLAIALGVANIALKEVKFSTSAKATNDAFFAADIGTECALFNDKANATGGGTYFRSGGPTSPIQCANQSINVAGAGGSGPWSFIVSQLGTPAVNCAIVTVSKVAAGSAGTTTTVNAKGYDVGGTQPNQCTKPNNSVERELETKYTTGASIPPINLALGKSVQQSSTYQNDPASAADRANDNNTNGNYYYQNTGGINSVSVTSNDPNSYWQIDLGANYTIQTINVWNCAGVGCVSTRLNGAHVFVAPEEDANIVTNDFTLATAQSKVADGSWSEFVIPSPAEPENSYSFSPPVVGRYVRVQLPGTDFLQLAEVQVMGN